jgi:hypothetical protein
MKYEELLKYARDALRSHCLETLVETAEVQCYRMAKPGTGIMRVLLTFTPEGICLQGDVNYGDATGLLSSRGYSRDWFAYPGMVSDYLASKFRIRRVWQADIAAESLRDLLANDQDLTPEQRQATEDVVRRLDLDDMGSEDFDQAYSDALELRPASIGMGYDPGAMACLVAVQERFAALWAEGRG